MSRRCHLVRDLLRRIEDGMVARNDDGLPRCLLCCERCCDGLGSGFGLEEMEECPLDGAWELEFGD